MAARTVLLVAVLTWCLGAKAPGGVAQAAPAERTYDVVIYGGTSAAVTAALQVRAMGRSVVIVSPDKHLGGLTSGGLGWTDSGKKAVIGGLAREFYHRAWKHYQKPGAWQWGRGPEYKNPKAHTVGGDRPTMWVFEPHVAEQTFDAWLAEKKIAIVRNAWLDRKAGVKKKDARIVSITTLDGRTFAGKMFLDATYEGDLMAAAGVTYHVGRESTATYGETWTGVQTGVLHHRHHFGAVKKPISPYVVPGDPSSGVLPRISADPPGQKGSADHRVQAYCFRMCLTDLPANRVPLAKPKGYDPKQYELLVRILDAGWREVFGKFDRIPNRKTDTNNHGPFSTDNIGMNYDYPEATYERRREITREHETYQKGWLYFLATDPRVPADIRKRMQQWGLAKDEFVDNGHWPHQIYVREARRMVGVFVMTENELLKRRPVPQPVGMGSYTMDSHNVQRYITPEGHVQNEGDIGVSTGGPYRIAFGSLLPKKTQCENLLVPVCVSSSHIAFGSIRMEPVFMILGQSAATAACQALEEGVCVQDVDYAKLRQRLLADGQVLDDPSPAPARRGGRGRSSKELGGLVVDDRHAKLTGDWGHSTAQGSWVDQGYLHDGNTNKGGCTVVFTAKLPKPGKYEVRLAYSAWANRATNVPVTVAYAGGEKTLSINQKAEPKADKLLQSLGVFLFAETATVTVSNAGTDGYVIADAVQFLPAK